MPYKCPQKKKEHNKKYHAKHYEENRDVILEKRRQDYKAETLEQKEKRKVRERASYKTSKYKERKAAWRKSNPEKCRAYTKKWSEQNTERIQEYGKRYRSENLESVKKRERDYKKSEVGRAKNNYYQSKRRAAEKQATPDWLTESQHLEIEQFYIEAKNWNSKTESQEKLIISSRCKGKQSEVFMYRGIYKS